MEHTPVEKIQDRLIDLCHHGENGLTMPNILMTPVTRVTELTRARR